MMISAEMAPFAKVGGLGDVTEALSRVLAARGHDVRIVLPLYGHLDTGKLKIRPLKKLPPLSLRVGGRVHDFRFHMLGSPAAKVKIYLLECAALYGRPGIYTDSRNGVFVDAVERASLHAQAALMLPRLLDWPVDILHAHDAEATPALLYRRLWYAGRELPGRAATVLTIHNLAHQEIHATEHVETLGLPRTMAAYPGLLEFHSQINLLKAGILAADQVNTVSPTYAEETIADEVFGCGLDGVLLSRGERYCGILNGGDYSTWDPARDKALPQTYGPRDLSGKAVCRTKLLKELKLRDGKQPLCGFVGRLVKQKGVELMLPLMKRLAVDGFTFAILGTGQPQYHEQLQELAANHPRSIAFVQDFNEPLAHRIYAGSDLFLMPSEFEPCGLSQMYCLRYGTPPVVRKTGGLADTVVDTQSPQGTGFVFDEAEPEAFLAALRRAQKLWARPDAWRQLQDRGMDCDFSWDLAAAQYEDLYRKAMDQPR